MLPTITVLTKVIGSLSQENALEIIYEALSMSYFYILNFFNLTCPKEAGIHGTERLVDGTTRNLGSIFVSKMVKFQEKSHYQMTKRTGDR